jgi:hypothetical protein
MMGETSLSAFDLSDLAPFHLESNTPLWVYILREAELQHDGKRLGNVGGRIVGEVFVGLLEGDPLSYLSQDPGWRPSLSSKSSGEFTIRDLLEFAGVVAPLT